MTNLQKYDTLVDKVLTSIEGEIRRRNKLVRLCTVSDLEDYTDEFYELPHSLYQFDDYGATTVKIYALEVDEDNSLTFLCVDGEDSHYKIISDDLLSDRCLFNIFDRIEGGNIY